MSRKISDVEKEKIIKDIDCWITSKKSSREIVNKVFSLIEQQKEQTRFNQIKSVSDSIFSNSENIK